MCIRDRQHRIELEREKALLEEQQRKTQELKDRLTPKNIGSKEKIELDLQEAKIREKDIQQEFHKRLASAESIQELEGTAGKLSEEEIRKYNWKRTS